MGSGQNNFRWTPTMRTWISSKSFENCFRASYDSSLCIVHISFVEILQSLKVLQSWLYFSPINVLTLTKVNYMRMYVKFIVQSVNWKRKLKRNRHQSNNFRANVFVFAQPNFDDSTSLFSQRTRRNFCISRSSCHREQTQSV